MNLVQFVNEDGGGQVALVSDSEALRLVHGYDSIYALVMAASAAGKSLAALVEYHLGEGAEGYATIVAEGRLLPPLTHPDPAHCFVTGTGLTHLGSADVRDAMHRTPGEAAGPTDSMKMFRDGLAGGKPAGGQAGVQPEWFYKGDGSIVVPGEHALTMPSFALDGGEEPEIVGCYVIGPEGTPFRVGFALGNEFSDHVTERQNYLLLSHSKLRKCAVGPELLTGPLPADIRGTSRIRRGDHVLWEKPFLSGEDNMSHSVANLEYHHFKYDLFRRPGDAHLHFFGTATLSVADGIVPQPGDRFEIEAPTFGRPLRNTLARAADRPVIVRPL
jgi:hypothetical protein